MRVLTILLLKFLLFINISYGEDFKSIHNFSAGDVLSADVLNELFTYIKESKTVADYTYILGAWTCTSLISNEAGAQNNTSEWSFTTSDNLSMKLNSTITFSDDGDSTYSLTTSSPNPIVFDNTSSYSSPFSILEDTMTITVLKSSGSKFGAFYALSKLSKNKFRMSLINQSESAMVNFVICNRKNIPPDAPTNLTSSVSSKSISLSWTDNSNNETGFEINRKDSLTGSYSLITTTNQNITSYTDTVSSSGTYWYRINSTNSNGDSVGTNLVKVTVE